MRPSFVSRLIIETKERPMEGLLSRERAAMLTAIARCWRDWKRSRSNIFDLRDCSVDETARIASYLGVSPAELRYIGSYAPDRANLLRHRMATLGLDPRELARTDPGTARELQRLCATCDSRGRCGLDLGDRFTDARSMDWNNYCPNAKALRVLSTIGGGTVQGTPGGAQ